MKGTRILPEGETEAAAPMAVCGLNALLQGEARAHRNVGYKNSVSRFHMLTMSKCNELRHELISRTYRPQKGEIHEVFEPKHRITVSAKYRDRVPQASFITNYFYPNVVPNLIDANYACLKGRGVDKARKHFKDILREADMDDWCLKTDMANYFASIDHDILMREIGRFMPDPWARWFFEMTLQNTAQPVGVDLGSEVYQLSGTSFPNSLDHLADDGHYIRYQDDIIYIGSKDRCRETLETIRKEAARLKLTLSEKKTFIQPVKRPVKFLGYSFLKKPTGRVTMKRLPEKVRKERRKLRRMKNKGVPIERANEHYRSVRESLKRGSRSCLTKTDKYYRELFKEDKNVSDTQRHQRAGKDREKG